MLKLPRSESNWQYDGMCHICHADAANPHCHSERSEESVFLDSSATSWPQNDGEDSLPQNDGEGGAALIVVLWSLFILSILALAINSYVLPQLDFSGRIADRLSTYYLAKAGVARAIFEIKNDATEDYDVLSDSWSDNESAFKGIELGAGGFSVVGSQEALSAREELSANAPSSGKDHGKLLYGLADEERKININTAPEYVLKNLMEVVGQVEPDEAERIAACIIDWRDEDDTPQKDGAEDIYYQSLYPPYRAENKDFDIPEKLLLVKGMTQKIYDKIKDEITIYGKGAVNINTADKMVLRSLGMSVDLADRIIRYRERIPGKDSAKDGNIFIDTGSIVPLLSKIGSPSGEDDGKINGLIGEGLISVRSDNFMGCSAGEIKDGGKSTKIIFVYNRPKDVIMYWRE